VIGLSCAVLASCEMPANNTLPTLSDIRPSGQTDQASESADGDAHVNQPVIALIHRIDLDLNEPLEEMWLTVDEEALRLPMRGKWMINGLRIGVLHQEQSQAFSDALPRIQGESRAKLIGSDYPSTIRTTPRLLSTITIDLTDPPRSPTQFQAIGGRLQLLAQVGRDEAGNAYLQLTPHHYKPKSTLLPRSPLEKEMDGQTFKALSLRVPLPRDRAVIVGLYRPWPVEEENPAQPADAEVAEQAAPGPAEGTTDEQVDPQTQQAKPKPPVIPKHLGRALMTGTRAGHATQMLLVISALDE